MSKGRLQFTFERALWCVALLGIGLCVLVRVRGQVTAITPLPTAVRASVVTVNNDFGFHLFAALSKQEVPNLMISPAGLEVSLGMLAQGAGGNTYAQLASSLGWQSLQTAQVPPSLQALAGELFAADPHVQVTSASALWVAKALPISSAFLRSNDKGFNIKVRPLRFSDPRAASQINTWVDHQTHGTIATIVQTGDVNVNTQLFATNTMAVKNTWMDKFDASLTTTEQFTPVDGSTRSVKMMHRTGMYPYCEDNMMQAVKLPCGAGKVSMVLLLPRAGQSLDAVCQTAFSTAHWTALLARLQPHTLRLSLPRVKLTSRVDLPTTLRSLGISDAFLPDQANFSRLSATRCYLNQFRHIIALEMNEGGIRPAVQLEQQAVVRESATVNPPSVMTANHPFLFALYSDDGTLLLLGSVTQPA